MNITNLSKKEKKLLIESISNTIEKLKEDKSESTIEETNSYKKLLEGIIETEPVDYPNPKLIKYFSKMLGGGFIETFRMNFKIFKYYSEEQMREHKREMVKKGFHYIDGEVTRDEKVINRSLVVTYTKTEN